MSRRNTEMFNLSFLDLLSGALGAVIFLFIITPKGGKAPATRPQVVVSIDTLHKQIFGTLHDSLATKYMGDTLLVLIKDFQKMPNIEDCPECPPPVVCPECPKCPEQRPMAQHHKSQANTEEIPTENPSRNENVKPVLSTKVNNLTPATADNPLVEDNQSKYKGDPPSVPCLVSFEITWADIDDNIDLYVCRDNTCVSGGNRKDKNIGYWDSGKSKTSLFSNDLRTTMEAVRQFDNIKPGQYHIYARFKESKKGNAKTTVKGLVYSKGADGKEHGERFSQSLILNPKEKTLLGKVELKADGTFTFFK